MDPIAARDPLRPRPAGRLHWGSPNVLCARGGPPITPAIPAWQTLSRLPAFAALTPTANRFAHLALHARQVTRGRGSAALLLHEPGKRARRPPEGLGRRTLGLGHPRCRKLCPGAPWAGKRPRPALVVGNQAKCFRLWKMAGVHRFWESCGRGADNLWITEPPGRTRKIVHSLCAHNRVRYTAVWTVEIFM